MSSICFQDPMNPRVSFRGLKWNNRPQ